ncbi:glycosyltransferase family 2 protein [Pedobacter antarcticus]|uniref:glycosyltransferase family 2 protein n=1 Tax=Pedobacter antarcticus TaxID=34086 RepID=UPI001C582163|nr:glycosyltransferase family 2 protein [Pedobacter antarcticus]
MKVTIITVVFNNINTIQHAIQSVISQTYKNIEYIIIDGGSTDGTLEKINEYKDQISQLISEPDKGIYDAMNKGVNRATGDIVAILNSDDFYTNEFVIEKVVKKFSESDCDGVYGDLDYVDNVELDRITRHWKSGHYKDGAFLYGWMPPHPSFFVKNDTYRKYGIFNLSLKSAADYELMLRFIHKNKIEICYLPEVLVKMRIGGASNSSLKNRLAANREDRRAWKLNGLTPYFFTITLKPLRKIFQFILR